MTFIYFFLSIVPSCLQEEVESKEGQAKITKKKSEEDFQNKEQLF